SLLARRPAAARGGGGAAVGGQWAEAGRTADGDCREPGPGERPGRWLAGRPAEVASVVAAWPGGDGRVVAAGTGGLPLGETSDAVTGEQGGVASGHGAAAFEPHPD